MRLGLGILGLRQTRVRARARLRVGGSEVSRRRLTKKKWVTVRTRDTPTCRVRVWFRAILLCLILKKGFSSSLIYS